MCRQISNDFTDNCCNKLKVNKMNNYQLTRISLGAQLANAKCLICDSNCLSEKREDTKKYLNCIINFIIGIANAKKCSIDIITCCPLDVNPHGAYKNTCAKCLSSLTKLSKSGEHVADIALIADCSNDKRYIIIIECDKRCIQGRCTKTEVIKELKNKVNNAERLAEELCLFEGGNVEIKGYLCPAGDRLR